MTESEQAEAWVYYQHLVKENGFDGITDLLASHNRMRVHIASAPTPEIVRINPGTYEIWYERKLQTKDTSPDDTDMRVGNSMLQADLEHRRDYPETGKDSERKYRSCPNTLTGEHRWLERIGKNADKPEQCTACKGFEVDLRLPGKESGFSVRSGDMKELERREFHDPGDHLSEQSQCRGSHLWIQLETGEAYCGRCGVTEKGSDDLPGAEKCQDEWHLCKCVSDPACPTCGMTLTDFNQALRGRGAP